MFLYDSREMMEMFGKKHSIIPRAVTGRLGLTINNNPADETKFVLFNLSVLTS
jgi:hypothetical protein